MTSNIKDRVVSQALWSILFCGEALPVGRLQGVPTEEEVRWSLLERLAELSVIEVDRFGRRIYGVLGITLVPTVHEIQFGTILVYARSAHLGLDTLNQLGESGNVSTPCPICSRRLVIFVRRGDVSRVRPRFHGTVCHVRTMIHASRKSDGTSARLRHVIKSLSNQG